MTEHDAPIFFHYVNVGPDVREDEMITDVYLPLKNEIHAAKDLPRPSNRP